MYPAVPMTMPGSVPADACDRRYRRGPAAGVPVELGEPEVDDLGQAIAGHHHVLRLEVAMDDARSVRLREPFGDLVAELDRRGAAEADLPAAARAASGRPPIPSRSRRCRPRGRRRGSSGCSGGSARTPRAPPVRSAATRSGVATSGAQDLDGNGATQP